MKKTILSFIFAVIVTCGYSQSFQYEVKSWTPQGVLIDQGDNTSSQQIRVEVGIVGEPYGFIQPTSKANTFTVVVPNKTKDIDWIKSFEYQEVLQWVKETYPNVK